jgi:hypothetical protein
MEGKDDTTWSESDGNHDGPMHLSKEREKSKYENAASKHATRAPRVFAPVEECMKVSVGVIKTGGQFDFSSMELHGHLPRRSRGALFLGGSNWVSEFSQIGPC